MAQPGYGLPLRCPKCPPEHAFGVLKVPGMKAPPCPNCGSKLVATRKKSRRGKRAVPKEKEVAD